MESPKFWTVNVSLSITGWLVDDKNNDSKIFWPEILLEQKSSSKIVFVTNVSKLRTRICKWQILLKFCGGC